MSQSAGASRTTERGRPLDNPPIIEAVLDLDTAMPPGFDITNVEAPAREAFGGLYPIFQPVLFQEHLFEQGGEQPLAHASRSSVQAYRFYTSDERQIVQVRTGGFSFNRLAPYSSLDDYLPDVEKAWRLFIGVASPDQVRVIRLRYINRIPLPTRNGTVELNDYFASGPRIPEEERFFLDGFLNQYKARERETGDQVNIILTSQPAEAEHYPVILDIEAFRSQALDVDDWPSILAVIQALRALKNRVFFESLTKSCLELFREHGRSA